MKTFLKLIILSAAISWGVFHVFPPVWSMANNADSLILLDIAHDIWSGKSLYGWNFPRVLYIFPDLLIALIVMAPGWYQDVTLLTIATINYSLLTLLVHRLLTQLYLEKTPSIPVTAILVAIALGIFAALFPFSMSNIFWQIFASGAHFLSVVLVVYIITLVPRERQTPISRPLGVCIVSLVLLAALSNSMSAMLISIMILARWFWGQFNALLNKQKICLIKPLEFGILIAIFAGVVIGAQVPRQSMANSFFSSSRFIYSIEVFSEWLATSWVNPIFLITLLLLSLCWAILSTPFNQAKVFSFPKSWKDAYLVIQNPYLFPALSIFVMAPFFYQEITRSLRYFAFPGLLSLLVLSLVLWLNLLKVLKKRFNLVLVIASLFTTLIFFIGLNPDKTYISDDALPKSWLEQASLESRLHPRASMYCLASTKDKIGLRDGVALFWTARPARFASDFSYYFAQVSPWNSRGGYQFWGANAMDFLYSDKNRIQKRNYNYILASDSDLSGHYWGSILSKASDVIPCGQYHIYFYNDTRTLTEFLFPWGMPSAIDGNGKETWLTNTNENSNELGPEVNFLSEDLKTVVGKKDSGKIYADNKEGFLVYGPYVNLPIGHYELIAYGNLTPTGTSSIGVLDVIGDGGQKTIAKLQFIPGSGEKIITRNSVIAKLEFTVDKPLREAEFRIYITSTVNGGFEGFTLKRRPM